jgi:HEAT repeat protein
MKLFHLCGLVALGLTLACLPAPARGQTFLGKSQAQWEKDLDPGKSVKQRRSAAFALGKMGKKAVTALGKLGERLDDQDAGVREAAAFAIGEICAQAKVFNPEVLKTLTDRLKDDADPLVRRSAAFAVGCIGKSDAAVRAALNSQLAHPDPAVRQNVAWALGRMGNEAAASLKKALKDGDAMVRRDAAGALNQLDADAAADAIPELLACCNNSDVEERKAAYAALVRLVTPDELNAAKAALIKGLKDPDIEIRRNAALAFANIGGPESAVAVPVLIEALQNGPRALRRQAALAFGPMGPAAKEAVPELRKALTDPDEEIRLGAAVSFIGLKEVGEPALPDLVGRMADKNEAAMVRAQSAVAISRIGFVPGLKGVMPVILQLAGDTTEKGKVRERVLWPVRVYLNNSEDKKPVYKTLVGIIDEPRTEDIKMLRYDSAYLLGMFQTADAPEKALDVLLEFLKDPAVKVYAGRKGGQTGIGEGKEGKVDSKEQGKDDGRIMAVDALARIGAARVNRRPEIVAQLQALDADPTTTGDFSKKIKALLEDLKKGK